MSEFHDTAARNNTTVSPGLDDRKCSQIFPLPLELDIRVLSFIQEDEFETRREWQATILAYSLSCRRFRSLVLPRLFAWFNTASPSAPTSLKDFCRAWVSGDETAIRCARHIKKCLFNHNTFIFGQTSHSISLINESLSSLTLLPNLTSLNFFFTGVQPAGLFTVLKTTRIEELCFVGDTVPHEVRHDHYGNEMSQIIATYATSLKTLRSLSCDIPFDLQILSRGNLKLEGFHILAHHTMRILPQSLKPFLLASPSITSLEFNYDLDSWNDFPSLDRTDLPNLHDLSCPLYFVPRILPGSRPIQTLQLLSYGSRVVEASPTDAAAFVNALRRSSRSLRKVKKLPPILATAAWGEYAPNLESISVIIPTNDSLVFDPLALPKMHQRDIANLAENMGGPSQCEHPFEWKYLVEVDIQPEDSAPSNGAQRDIEAYSILLKLQRTDVATLTRRFPSLLDVRLGLYTRWKRPLDVPDEWKVRVIYSDRSWFEKLVVSKYNGTSKLWREWDFNGILEGILEGRSEIYKMTRGGRLEYPSSEERIPIRLRVIE